jgi:hypothetical protein
MAKRFSDIDRAGELKYAFDNYNAYKTNLATRQTVRVTGTGTPKARNLVKVAVYPFTSAPIAQGTTYEDYQVSMTKASLDGVSPVPSWGKTEALKYFDDTPANTVVAAPKGFQAARMTTFEPGGAASYVKSKFTKLYYAKRPGTSAHYPIGRLRTAPGTGDEQEAKSALRAALATELGTTAGRRVSFKDERAPRV